MNSANLLHSKTTPAHRAKLAYVYLRQSSPGQLQHNTESTTRQYALVERAVALGWPRDRVKIIDGQLLTQREILCRERCSGTIRLRMSKKRAEMRTITVKQTIEKG